MPFMTAHVKPIVKNSLTMPERIFDSTALSLFDRSRRAAYDRRDRVKRKRNGDGFSSSCSLSLASVSFFYKKEMLEMNITMKV